MPGTLLSAELQTVIGLWVDGDCVPGISGQQPGENLHAAIGGRGVVSPPNAANTRQRSSGSTGAGSKKPMRTKSGSISGK
jgi:hypothetical protein